MVLESEDQCFHILRSLGPWDKAEDLLRGTLKSLGAKSPPQRGATLPLLTLIQERLIILKP